MDSLTPVAGELEVVGSGGSAPLAASGCQLFLRPAGDLASANLRGASAL